MKLIGCCVLAAALAVSACGGDDDGGMMNLIPTSPTSNVSFSATDLRVGTGAEATTGRPVSVRYSGWLYAPSAADNKGTPFDSGSFSFTVGTGVVAGFSMGVNGMRVGGLRRVVIPPNLGYGNNPPANSVIRANETLLFEIELLAVQ
jgi:FKBP-type peptidyl-prolyl cis-trans isomerase FkpA